MKIGWGRGIREWSQNKKGQMGEEGGSENEVRSGEGGG